MNLDIKTVLRYFLLIGITVITIYYLPQVAGTFWLIALLFLYWFSKDEPFWMAFFLVVTDGFMSFFGLYEATLRAFPGLPGVEVGQFYILLTILKARYKTQTYPLFYKSVLNIMGIFLIILILLSLVIGVKNELNAYFRILKLTFPFLLFYSIPRLIKNRDDFNRFFSLIFPIGILASVSQIFEIVNLQSLSVFLGARGFVEEGLKEEEALRSFYNSGIILLTMFGSLYYSSHKESVFRPLYLLICVFAASSMAFLSATRGWIIGFGIILILFVILEGRFKTSRFLLAGVLVIALLFALMSTPLVRNQINNAYTRLTTIEKIAEGDITAGGTNIRNTKRSPRVMKKWRESPVFGYGFSDDYMRYRDGHVGNQNLLLNSGIVGFSLIAIFFTYFILVLYKSYFLNSQRALLVFILFIIGWIVIHSTSGQHFSYGYFLSFTMTQSLFFCFGAFCVAEAEGKIFLPQ